SEELIAFAGLLRDSHCDPAQKLGQILRLAHRLGLAPQVRLPLLLHDLLVRLGGGNRQLLGQQIISRITGGDLHHLAARAQFIDVFPEYYFHFPSPLDADPPAAPRSSRAMRTVNMPAPI